MEAHCRIGTIHKMGSLIFMKGWWEKELVGRRRTVKQLVTVLTEVEAT